jgi:Mg2+/Co2+ transporter CorB
MRLWFYYAYYSVLYLYYWLKGTEFTKGDLIKMHQSVFFVKSVTPLTITLQKIDNFSNSEEKVIRDHLPEVTKL